MKQIAVLLARSVWQFDMAQLNPGGMNLWPACEWLIKKYQFAVHPKNILDVNNEKALAFQAGAFINSKGSDVLVSLAVFANGFVVDASSSTDDSDEFLQNVATEISQNFRLTVPPNIGKAYISQVEVESQFSLAAVDPKLLTLAESLDAKVRTVDGKPRRFDFGVLQFWTEDVNATTAPAYFRFERKLGLPFSSNRYFSQAALRTKEHYAFLEELEIAFKT